MSISIKGIAVSRGIAIGHAHTIERGIPEVAAACVPDSQIENEVERLRTAINSATLQLQKIRQKIPATTPSDIAAFIDTHLLMTNDASLSDVPAHLIREQRYSAEWALKVQLDSLVQVFDEMDDPYLSTRKDDVVHVVNRILHFLNHRQHEQYTDQNMIENRIIIADDLTPADIVMLQHQGMIAFITESGGPLSHTAIMAKSLQLPAIVGMPMARHIFRNEETIIVDGEQGIALCDPSEQIYRQYQEKKSDYREYRQSLGRLRHQAATSLDGIHVSLQANIELPQDMDMIRETGADGVGLFRTEYLFMNRTNLPDEEEQFAAYRDVLQAMQEKPVTIRTMDLGADKPIQHHQFQECPTNPALGLRAVRLCLKEPSLFNTQLRAILRASVYGQARIMIPMLANTMEIRQVLGYIQAIKAELHAQAIAFDDNIPIGGTIEVPAAAIAAPIFARHLDFMSIGTNDLIQYTLAIDRADEEVNYLYDPCHPSVIKLILTVLKAGQQAGIPVAMCGEMAGDSQFTRLLLGLGLREFSMHPTNIPEIKNIIQHSDVASLIKPSRALLKCDNSEASSELLQQINHSITKH